MYERIKHSKGTAFVVICQTLRMHMKELEGQYGCSREREGKSGKCGRRGQELGLHSRCDEVPLGVSTWVSDKIWFMFSKICLAAVWRIHCMRKSSIRPLWLST